jgi:hypothetical protein
MPASRFCVSSPLRRPKSSSQLVITCHNYLVRRIPYEQMLCQCTADFFQLTVLMNFIACKGGPEKGPCKHRPCLLQVHVPLSNGRPGTVEWQGVEQGCNTGSTRHKARKVVSEHTCYDM